MASHTRSEPVTPEPVTPGDPGTSTSDLARSCAELQQELDGLLEEHEGEAALTSLDTAVASLRDVQEQNVSSVQLVALERR